MDDHEQHTDVALLLRRAASEAPPDLDPSAAVAGAVRRGQRLRRRRVQGQWLGAVAMAATVAVGVVLVHEWVQPGPRESVTLAPTESASPQVITPVPPAPRGHRSVIAVYDEVVSAYGKVQDVTSYPYGLAGQRMAQGFLVDRSGPGAVHVSVARDTTTADEAVGCEVEGSRVTSCQTLDPGSACPADLRCLAPADGVAEACPPAAERLDGTEPCTILDDGTIVVAESSRTYKDERDQGEYVNEATAYRPGGLQVHAQAFNGAGEKLGASRSAPALALAQLRVIVADRAWVGVDLGN